MRDEDLSLNPGPFTDPAERRDIRSGTIKAHQLHSSLRYLIELVKVWPLLRWFLAGSVALIIWWNNGGSEFVTGLLGVGS